MRVMFVNYDNLRIECVDYDDFVGGFAGCDISKEYIDKVRNRLRC